MPPSSEFLSLGFSAIDWIERYLVHGPGDVQGQPIELDDELAAFVVKAYRVNARGERLVRRAFLSRAKGRNKSGLAAMIACFEALGPCRFDHFAVEGEVSPWGYGYAAGEPVGVPLTYVEILNVATEEGQAGNTYDAIYYSLHSDTCSAELLHDYGKIDVGLTRINLPGSRGFIEPITSSDNSKDGGKSTFIVADETHLWLLPRLKRLHGIMTRNLLKRRIASGWMLETSTMYGQGEDSVAEGTHAYARDHARSGALLFDHKQASEKWDLSRRGERMSALREAYGPAAEWMNLAAIADSWDDPQVSEAEFRRFWLNQPVPMVIKPKSEIDHNAWAAAADERSKIVGTVAVALDVSPHGVDAAVAVAGGCDEGMRQGELVDYRPGTGWLVERAVAVAVKAKACIVVLDPTGPAGAFKAELTSALEPHGIKLHSMTARDYAQSCGALVADLKSGLFRHIDQKPLNDAVSGARTRGLSGAFAWSREDSSVSIAPLVAVTLARFGYVAYGLTEAPKPFFLVGS